MSASESISFACWLGSEMGALLGLGVGIGLLAILASVFLPAPERVPTPGRTAQLLSHAGLGQVSVASFWMLCAACAGVTAMVLLTVSNTWTIALAFGVMAGYLPIGLLKGRKEKRYREYAEAWPDAIDNLTSAVRAGLSLPEALGALSERGPEVLRPAFREFTLDYQASGRFGPSLDRLKDRLADPVGDRVVEGLRVAREVGGGELGRILRNLSVFLREDARTRSELLARQAWTVNGARLAVAAPWLVLLLMAFQSEVITRYATATGALILAIGGAVCVVAYRLMMRIGRLPSEKRVFG